MKDATKYGRSNRIVKQYSGRRDLISAFYQLWTLPSISSSCAEGTPTDYTELSDICIWKGIEEIPFCMFVDKLPLSQLYFLWGSDGKDKISARANLDENTLEIMFHNNNGILFDKIRSDITAFHPARSYPIPDTVILHYSDRFEDKESAMKSVFRKLRQVDYLKNRIMTAKDNYRIYRPYEKDKKKVIGLYVYQKGSRIFIAYDTFNDILVKANLHF